MNYNYWKGKAQRFIKEKVSAVKHLVLQKIADHYLTPHGTYEIARSAGYWFPVVRKKLPYLQFSIYKDLDEKALKSFNKNKQLNLNTGVELKPDSYITATIKDHDKDYPISVQGKIYWVGNTFILVNWNKNSWDDHDDLYSPSGMQSYWNINKIRNTYHKTTSELSCYLNPKGTRHTGWWDDYQKLNKSIHEYVAVGNNGRLEFSIRKNQPMLKLINYAAKRVKLL